MSIVCPACDNDREFESAKGEKEIKIRNESINIEFDYHKCKKCGEEFIIPNLDEDPIKKAFGVYRSKHQLLLPAEIKGFREKYGLTQGELAKLSGLGTATLSRYESGKLQEESHDRLLRLIMDSECLRKIVNDSIGILAEEKKAKILDLIGQNAEQNGGILKRSVTIHLWSDVANEYSGFKKFDLKKFTNAILFLCKGQGVVKTKLNKLLFYADFLYFKEYVVSITGAQYAHIPFGPAPDNFDLLFPLFIRQGLIKVEEIEFPEYSGEKYIAAQEPDLNVFSDSELRILASISECFKDFTASQLSNYSHRERAYQETKTGELISFLYSKYLNVPEQCLNFNMMTEAK